MGKTKVMEISRGIAEAIKACRPQVISAYPITPQTHIIEHLAQMVADGELDCEFVSADSEFAAASIVHGASATGVRTYTASASQGLLLMTEVLWNMAGTRLPVVLTGANRVVSAPISIQVDHQDTLSLRDSGVMQMYVEDAQEAYDAHIQAYKLAEDPDILLPILVCVDGWSLTHTWEPIELLDQGLVDEFLPPYHPVQYLTPDNPITYGSYADDGILMEFKYMMHRAMNCAKNKVVKIVDEFNEMCGRHHGGLIQEYRTDDAKICMLAMGSIVGTIKVAIDEMRAEGIKVGLVKVRFYRPFPADELIKAVKNAQCIAVIDRDVSVGAGGALSADVKAALCNLSDRPLVLGCLAGIGGREITKSTVRSIVANAQRAIDTGRVEETDEWIGLNPEVREG